MNRIGKRLFALTSVLVSFLSVARAYEYDSNTVGYADYGGASYARDYCYEPNSATKTKVRGLYIKNFGDSRTPSYYAGMCQRNSLGQWQYTTPRGAANSPRTPVSLECPYQTDAVDGLRGYSDQWGISSISTYCNNGSYSTPLNAMTGNDGPYYNAVRCPSGSVAWGLWSSVKVPRIGRLGMICNSWWP